MATQRLLQVIPKKQPLDQDWLEEFGTHLVQENWLCQEEYNTTWVRGGYYRRNLGDGLCVINLNRYVDFVSRFLSTMFTKEP